VKSLEKFILSQATIESLSCLQLYDLYEHSRSSSLRNVARLKVQNASQVIKNLIL